LEKKEGEMKLTQSTKGLAEPFRQIINNNEYNLSNQKCYANQVEIIIMTD
jgi:hypothetical protein